VQWLSYFDKGMLDNRGRVADGCEGSGFGSISHLHCVTKATALWRTILEIFGEHVAKKVSNQMVLYFSPHLTSASALPGETENRKITHLFTLTLNVVMPRDTENTFILSLGHR